MIDDLYQAGTDQALDDRVARATKPLEPAPGAFNLWSFLKAAPRGIGAGIATGIAASADRVGAFGQVLGAYPEALGVGPLTEQQQKEAAAARDKLREGIDYSSPAGDVFRARAAELMPDPATAHFSERFIAGLGSTIGDLALGIVGAGPLAPAQFALDQGMAEADKLRAQNVDLGTRTKAAVVHGVGQGILASVPVIGKTVAETAGLVAAVGTSNVAQIATEQRILKAAGYDKPAAQYDPFDPWTVAMGYVLPGVIGFGGRAIRGAPAAEARAPAAPPTVGTGGPAATATLVRNADGSYSVPEAPGRGQPALQIAGPKTEADVRAAAALTPAEQATSDAFERSPGNLRELDAAIKTEKNPANRAVLVAERERLATVEAVKADPTLADAARVNQVVRQMNGSSLAPAGDLAGMNAHATALEKAVDQLSNGEPVDVSGIVKNIELGKLTGRMAEIEDRFARLLEDHEGAVERYKAIEETQGGKVINTDIARELSPDYLADRTASAGVHEPASAFIKRYYADKLRELQPGQVVAFTSGGTGAGKTSAIQQIPAMKALTEAAGIIFDTNMNALASAQKKIEQALSAGGNVTIFHVQRDPVESLTVGALPRAMNQEKKFGTGRTVPIVEHARTHRGAAEVIQQLAKIYKDDPRVAIQIIDNTRGKNQARPADLGFVKGFDYNGVEAKLDEALERARKTGAISESVYLGTRGPATGRGSADAQGVERADARRDDRVAEHAQAGREVSPEIRAWLGDSKVVDSNGKPLVVYHGTRADFEDFDPALSELGAFFTADRGEAAQYGGRVVGAYLSIQNPARVKGAAHHAYDLLGELGQSGALTRKQVADARAKIGDGGTHDPSLIRDALRESGHDGIIYENAGEAPWYVAFDAAQIKAAEPAAAVVATGNKAVAITERGTEIPVQWAVVEAADLVTSHGNDLAKNAAYPAELQPRDRGRAASEQQIAKIENAIKPQLLGESPKASDGAPIVGPDGVVESGNARTIALRRAYASGKADHYKTWLQENAAKVGLDRKTVAGMKNPVLVRVSEGGYDRADFARQANESPVASMSQTEQAKTDADNLPDLEQLVANDDGTINVARSADFIRGFMTRAVSPSEQGSMMTATGELSQQGLKRIRDAVFARAYGDPELVAMMAESTDANVKNVLAGMMRAAPRVAQLADLQAAGARPPGDITGPLVQAVRKFSQLRADGMTVDTFLSQKGMFDEGAMKPEAEQMLRAISADSRAPKRIAETITNMVDSVDALGDPRQFGMFGEAPSATEAALASAEQSSRQSRIDELVHENPDRPVRLPDGEETTLAKAIEASNEDFIAETKHADLASVAADCYLRAAE